MEGFLIAELGEEKGKELYLVIIERFERLVKRTDNRSKSQKRLLEKTILPRIALYQVLMEHFKEDKVQELLSRYMRQIGASLNATCKHMEKLPFFYALYSHIFTAYVRKSDAWTCETTEKDRNHFRLTIHKCLWNDACEENGCPGLCRYFCECDEITYRDMKKLRFTRTQTLGTGGEMCDFTFYKK